MARSNGRKPDASAARTPVYHVVRVDGDTLTIVERNVRAKNQIAASDAYVDALPAEQRNGEFGAFLASSLKTDEYEAETITVTRKKSDRSSPVRSAVKAPDPDPVAVS